MPVIELTNIHFSRSFSGNGVFYTNSDSSTYIVDSVLPGSTSGNRSLRIIWNEHVSIRWTVANPSTFGSNIRIGIAVKYINLNFLQVGRRAEAGIFIGNISAGVGVIKISSTTYQYYVFLKRGTTTLVSNQISPSFFEQIFLRQETSQILFHYAFANPNTKNLINTFSASTIPASGQAGFFLFTEIATSGTVFFDYFFVEEFISA
jgi:hypothetical protein